MAKSDSGAARWVAGVAVLIGLGAVAWFVSGGTFEGGDAAHRGSELAAAPAAPPFAAEDAAANRLRIPAGGRLSLELDELPDTGPLLLALDLSDEARGSGERTVRVASADGRRLDTTAIAISGAGSGLELRIDPSFFGSTGRYLVEVDTVEAHPLRLRRYVIELK